MKRNIIANVLGRFWGVLSVYLFVPLYIKILGIEAYGVIGFYAVAQGILSIADAGLTATLNRELARLSSLPGREKEMRDLVRTVEVLYWVFAVVAGIALSGLAEPIVYRWMNVGSLSKPAVVNAVRLMLWAVVLQFPAMLYQGGLLGLQRQILSNVMQIVWSILRNGGVVLLIVYVAPTLEVFFAWSIACNAVYALTAGVMLWRCMPSPASSDRSEMHLAVFLGVWKYALGMAGMTILSAIFMQTDKLIVSRFVPLKVFGYYSVASIVSQVPVLIAGPIAVAIFPRLTVLVARRADGALADLYHRSCQIVAIVAIPAGVTIALFSQQMILAWTKSADVAQNAGGIASWFMAGSVALALQVIPYRLALAHGHIRLNLKLGVASLFVIVPLLFALVNAYGAVGGAVAWTALNVGLLFPFMWKLHALFLPDAGRRWFRDGVGIPLAVSLCVGVVARWLIPASATGALIVAAIGASGVVSCVACTLSIPGLYAFLRRRRAIGDGMNEAGVGSLV